MLQHPLFCGQFVSRSNVLWEVIIWGEQDQSPAQVGELTFPAEQPLVIEWSEASKEEPLCPSSATLRIISPSDRTYQHLYTIEAGRIGMDVKRGDALYWRGTLDAELYEEPYERLSDYVVELTFSDFGLLDRERFTLSGTPTLTDILHHAAERARLLPLPIDTQFISTRFSETAPPLTLEALSIRADNFIDEEGERSTLREVVEAILQPLALRLVQRDGRLCIYDLNGLYHASPKPIRWTGDTQTMSVDKVANAVNINFSPYAQTTLLTGELDYTAPTSSTLRNIDLGGAVGYIRPNDSVYGDYYSLRSGLDESGYIGGDGYAASTLFLSREGKGVASLGMGSFYYKNLPHVVGTEEKGILAFAKVGRNFGNSPSPALIIAGEAPFGKWQNSAEHRTDPIYGTQHVLTSHPCFVSANSDNTHLLRVQLPMLIDLRYNPFVSESTDLAEMVKEVKVRSGFVFIPFAAILRDADGVITHYYDNQEVAMRKMDAYQTGSFVGALGLDDCLGTWREAKANIAPSFLEYYDVKDTSEGAGILDGWHTNRHTFGYAMQTKGQGNAQW